MMMVKKKIKHVSELPDWFHLEKYKEAENLNISGWARNLLRRYELSQSIKYRNMFLDLYLSAPEEEREIRLEKIKNLALTIQDSWDKIKAYPVINDRGQAFGGGISAIAEITPSDLISGLISLGREKLQAAIAEMEPYLQRKLATNIDQPDWLEEPLSGLTSPRSMNREFLKVNTRLPDDILIEDFKKWLKETRRNEDHEKTRKARKANFSIWVTSGVLPYLDLSTWAEIESVSIPDRVFADAVFPNGDGGEDKIRKTTAPLARELVSWDSVHSLIDQYLSLPPP